MNNSKKRVPQPVNNNQKFNFINVDHIPNGIKQVHFQPAKGMVLLDLMPIVESKTKGGIIIPENTQKDRVIKCIIVRVSLDNPVYEVGDLVAIMPGSAMTFEYEGYIFYLAYETSVQGKYENIKYFNKEEIPTSSSLLTAESPELILPFSDIKGEA